MSVDPRSYTIQRADHTAGHFFHQPSAMAYNGAQPTVAELTQDFGNVDKSNTLPTLNRKDHSYCPHSLFPHLTSHTRLA
jgi:hypothetical protein